jgi:hypothetical protein
MKRSVRIVCFTIAALTLLASRSYALLCFGDSWSGVAMGVTISRTGTLEVTVTGTTALSHSSAHTNSCVGTLHQQLSLLASYNGCASQSFNLPVTFNTPHTMTHSLVCGSLPRAKTYNGGMTSWWNDDEPPTNPTVGSMETDFSVTIPADADGDGWEEGDDCNDAYYDLSNTCSGGGGGCDPDPDEVRACEHQSDNYYWDYGSCSCQLGASPIIIDLDGDGLTLTSARNGVLFDLLANGEAVDVAWTAAGSQEAFLALDRDGDGLISSGSELFGNYTDQPRPVAGDAPNGFLALAVFDDRNHGGNEDGRITRDDRVFSRLRLWIDENHDGISQTSELTALSEHAISEIGLSYRLSRKVDANGNVMRYRGVAYATRQTGRSHQRRLAVVDVLLQYLH